MNRKTEAEKLETELGTLTARREKIAGDLQVATEAAQEATEAIASGAAVSARATNAGSVKAVLQDAYAAILAKIEPLQSKLSTAKADAGKTERAENYEAALKEYDAATIGTARIIREFAEANAAALQSIGAAQSAVNHAEREMIRAGERRVEQTGALQFRRDCGDVRPILGHLNDFLTGKTYASLSTPPTPEHARDLSKAGIV